MTVWVRIPDLAHNTIGKFLALTTNLEDVNSVPEIAAPALAVIG